MKDPWGDSHMSHLWSKRTMIWSYSLGQWILKCNPKLAASPQNLSEIQFPGHTPDLLNQKHSNLFLISPPGNYDAHSWTSGCEEESAFPLSQLMTPEFIAFRCFNSRPIQASSILMDYPLYKQRKWIYSCKGHIKGQFSPLLCWISYKLHKAHSNLKYFPEKLSRGKAAQG
jgi:hypothetical protein